MSYSIVAYMRPWRRARGGGRCGSDRVGVYLPGWMLLATTASFPVVEITFQAAGRNLRRVRISRVGTELADRAQ